MKNAGAYVYLFTRLGTYSPDPPETLADFHSSALQKGIFIPEYTLIDRVNPQLERLELKETAPRLDLPWRSAAGCCRRPPRPWSGLKETAE